MRLSARARAIVARRGVVGWLMAWALVIGCGRIPSPEPSVSPRFAKVRFHNGTESAVRVYVMESSSVQWSIGHVAPGETSQLSLPAGLVQRSDAQAFLVAVPVGELNVDGQRGADVPDAVRSPIEMTSDLVKLRWQLRGQQLFGELPVAAQENSESW